MSDGKYGDSEKITPKKWLSIKQINYHILLLMGGKRISEKFDINKTTIYPFYTGHLLNSNLS